MTTQRAWGLALLLSGCNLVGYGDHTDRASTDAAVFPATISPADLDAGRAALDGATARAIDAASTDGNAGDADALAPGWWASRTPDVVCAKGKKCWPMCEPGVGQCVFDCGEASECEDTCLPGTTCEVTCRNVGRCFMACKADGRCWQDCGATDSCEAWCAGGSTCTVDCAGATSCHAMCLAGSHCDIDCTRGADCSAFTCEKGAACLLRCADDVDCTFDCEGAGSSCPNHSYVCDRACP